MLGAHKKTGPRKDRFRGGDQDLTGILPILICYSCGPVSCTLVPAESTATVTGISWTSNS